MRLFILIIICMFLFPGYAIAEGEGDSDIVVIDAEGVIIPPLASYIERGMEYADDINAEAVVIVLDTPGGAVDVTFEIIQTIRNIDVPVVVYVGPPGAQSASAGLLIVLSGHMAAMAPDTAIGASSPIDLTGADLPETAGQKAEEYLSAQARSLAQGRGQAAIELADAAVAEAKAVSYTEAIESGLVDYISDDLEDLLRMIDGDTVVVNGNTVILDTASYEIIEVEMTLLEQILSIIVNPNIVALFITLGPLLIIIEVKSPGGWVSGTLGAILTGLALYGLGILPVNWLGMIFIAIAIVLFVLEVKATTHGILAAVAVANVIAGSIILFSGPGIELFGTLSIPLLVGQSLFIGVVFAVFAYLVMRAMKLPVTTGYEGLVGKIGRVTEAIDPEGLVLVWGERWKALTDGDPIKKGESVIVEKAESHRVVVRRVDG